MPRTTPGWNARADNPHRHTLPARVSYTDPANDRRCLKNGPHRGNLVVKCRVSSCDYTFGTKCEKCKRVV